MANSIDKSIKDVKDYCGSIARGLKNSEINIFKSADDKNIMVLIYPERNQYMDIELDLLDGLLYDMNVTTRNHVNVEVRYTNERKVKTIEGYELVDTIKNI